VQEKTILRTIINRILSLLSPLEIAEREDESQHALRLYPSKQVSRRQ
jgi:hypothetical protein